MRWRRDNVSSLGTKGSFGIVKWWLEAKKSFDWKARTEGGGWGSSSGRHQRGCKWSWPAGTDCEKAGRSKKDKVCWRRGSRVPPGLIVLSYWVLPIQGLAGASSQTFPGPTSLSPSPAAASWTAGTGCSTKCSTSRGIRDAQPLTHHEACRLHLDAHRPGAELGLVCGEKADLGQQKGRDPSGQGEQVGQRTRAPRPGLRFRGRGFAVEESARWVAEP